MLMFPRHVYLNDVAPEGMHAPGKMRSARDALLHDASVVVVIST